MPNTRETVRALVSAFNVHNYARDTVKTNFTLQSEGKKDYIVVSFEKSMDTYQCSEYLDSIKRKIIREFYGIEESNDAEILDTAKLIFDVNSFPFNISDRDWSLDEQHGLKFVTPVDKGVIFNLKSHLAFSLKKDVQEDMSIYITAKTFNKKKYLWCGEFDNKGLCKQFESEFLSRMENRYGYRNVFKNPLKVEGNSVYIKDVFDDACFIDSVTRYIAWLVGIDLGVSNDVDHSVMLLKDSIINSFHQSTKTIVAGFMCASPLNREEASILIPIMQDCRGARFLTKEEARDINHAFNNVVLDDVSDKTQATFKVNGSSAIYGIDFSNKEISHCVITKIIESSVINKDHELAIDPERALSPAQSPFNSPTHAEPPRTTPNQRKGTGESGYDSSSPPKPKDSGSSSGGPRSLFEQPQTQRFPTPSQDEALEDSPRRGSEQGSETEKEGRLLHNHVNSAGTSKGFWPSTQLSSTAVSHPGPSSSHSVGSAKNVQAGPSAWSQPIDAWLSQSTSGSKWQSSPEPGSSGLSWKGANESGSASTSAVPGISESGEGSNVATVPVDNKRPQSLLFTNFSTRASDKTVKAFLCFLDRFSSPEGKKQLPLLLSSEAGKQLSSISCEQEELLDFLFSTEGKEQLYSLLSSGNKQQLYSLFSPRGQELLFPPSPEGQKLAPLVLSPEGKEQLPSLLSLEGERISKPFSLEAGNIIFLLTCSSEEPKNMSRRSFRDKLAIWLHCNSLKVASPQEKPLTNDEKKELRPLLLPNLQKQLDSNSLKNPQLIYLLYTPGGQKKLDLLLSSPEKKGEQLHPDLLFKFFGDEQEISGNASTSSKDSGVSSGFPASPAVPHKESVSSELKHLQQVKNISEALRK